MVLTSSIFLPGLRGSGDAGGISCSVLDVEERRCAGEDWLTENIIFNNRHPFKIRVDLYLNRRALS